MDRLSAGYVTAFVALFRVRCRARINAAFNSSLLAPTIIGLFDNSDPPDRVKTGQTCDNQQIGRYLSLKMSMDPNGIDHCEHIIGILR